MGDEISEESNVASKPETIKERIRKLRSKGHDIIKICESPIMGGLGYSITPFKLFRATVEESLLTNCKWRIAQKKLLFLNQLMKRDISNLAKQVVYEGVAYECSQICNEIGIQDIMFFETT